MNEGIHLDLDTWIIPGQILWMMDPMEFGGRVAHGRQWHRVQNKVWLHILMSDE